MPPHFWMGAHSIDYTSAVKADASRQNYTVAPRHWYIDATVACRRCHERFCFSAEEQKSWYEGYGFYVDSFPTHCPTCRRDLRDLKALRQEYDRDIANALAGDDCRLKARLLVVIDRLRESD